TCAAKPRATRITPTEKRMEESSAMDHRLTGRWGATNSAAAARSRDRGATGPGAGGGVDDDGARLDLEDEAAIGAGVDERRPAEPAHRADDREVVAAAIAARRARGEDQCVAPA